jgi:hypothetical protein
MKAAGAVNVRIPATVPNTKATTFGFIAAMCGGYVPFSAPK